MRATHAINNIYKLISFLNQSYHKSQLAYNFNDTTVMTAVVLWLKLYANCDLWYDATAFMTVLCISLVRMLNIWSFTEN